ncbi:MAG TPA: ATP-dependent chaperone ClpB [Solibacterales bacterium]|nr:ATP-dependent chaperone ClpB [Bryobacterales bacterium]
MFRFDKLTQKAQEALQQSQRVAEQNQQQAVSSLHLLVALIGEREGVVRPVLEKCNVQPDALAQEAQRSLKALPKVTSTGPQASIMVSPAMNQLLESAFQEAERFKDEFVSTEHLLLAMSDQKYDPAGALLVKSGATHDAILKALVAVRGTQRVTDQNPEAKYQALERYTVDLTDQARKGKLDPVIGRDEEIRRVMQVLSRRTKNNPVLIGEPGVGKTAIVEGLAQRIVKRDVPEQLQHKKLISIDMGTLVAGTKFRGEFEDRLKAVLKEITEARGEIICFIDELHTLVGAGGGEGSIDAANMLKPALARGDLRCIGATTLSEYRKYIEKDAALARRFQTVLVGQSSVEDTIAILRGLKEKYEIHHGVRVRDAAIVAAAVLSDRYITDRFLPDKAIDLIDEAGSALRIQIGSMPIEIDSLERRVSHLEIERQALHRETDTASRERLRQVENELERLRGESATLQERWKREKTAISRVRQLKEQQEQLREDEEKATRTGEWEKAAELKYGRRAEIERELETADKELESIKSGSALLKEEIDEEDIAKIVAKWTGIPVSRMLEGEVQKLIRMEARLEDRVIGQNPAVQMVANAIRRNRAGLSDPNRPIGSFIFLGPTGVGKTELARALAEFLFDNEKSMIRVDMSEYMEKHSVSRMIGAPPGYVGYDEGGQLSEHVRRKPYSVVLFDEIEKAHPDVFNALLQILDDGRLTDGQGRTVNFKNTVIIMTSNVGSNIIHDNGPIGFSVNSKAEAEPARRLMEALRQTFRPEFLNRVDEVIVFNPLTRDDLTRIIEIQLGRVERMLADRGLHLELTPAAKETLITDGYDPNFGARPMRRSIQRLVQDPLALQLLEGKYLKGDTIVVDTDGADKKKLRFEKRGAPVEEPLAV